MPRALNRTAEGSIVKTKYILNLGIVYLWGYDKNKGEGTGQELGKGQDRDYRGKETGQELGKGQEMGAITLAFVKRNCVRGTETVGISENKG